MKHIIKKRTYLLPILLILSSTSYAMEKQSTADLEKKLQELKNAQKFAESCSPNQVETAQRLLREENSQDHYWMLVGYYLGQKQLPSMATKNLPIKQNYPLTPAKAEDPNEFVV